jgi:hypothetical protein
MYGIINKAIGDLVTKNFGEDKWLTVLEKSGIEEDFFISNEPYDDAITYKLAISVSETMNITVDEVLYAFGEWWILETIKSKYSGLLETGGKNLRDFLINLPSFHNHIMLMYPKLTPPEFKVSDLAEDSIQIHYFSKREGLQEFVSGLLTGLGKLYNCPAKIEHIDSKKNGNDHEIFKVSW